MLAPSALSQEQVGGAGPAVVRGRRRVGQHGASRRPAREPAREVLLDHGNPARGVQTTPVDDAHAAQTARVSQAISDVADLQSRHDMLLGSLKDLEDDHATGKLTDEDYESVRGGLTAQAVQVLKQLDAAQEREQRTAQTAPRPVAVDSRPAADADR